MENNNFNNWYNKIVESISVPNKQPKTNEDGNTTATTVTVDAPSATASTKSDIISDVDTIMTSLETLAKELKEELQLDESQQLNELSLSGIGSSVLQYIWTGPRAKKMQSKINKMKLAKVDLKFAADNAKDNRQSTLLSKKEEVLSNQIDSAQDALEDRYKSSGEIVDRMIRSEKLRGELEVAKKTLGMDPSDSEKENIVDRMKKLQQSYNKELQSIQELEPSAEEKRQAKEALDKKKADEQAARDAREKARKERESSNDSSSAEQSTNKSKSNDSAPEKEKSEDKNADKIKQLEADIEHYNKVIQDELASIEKNKNAKKTEQDPQEIARLTNLIKNSEDDEKELRKELNNTKTELRKLQDATSAKESLILAATELGLNEMANELESKQEWQFENNSALYSKYKMQIDKALATKKINESTAISIADKFKLFLG